MHKTQNHLPSEYLTTSSIASPCPTLIGWTWTPSCVAMMNEEINHTLNPPAILYTYVEILLCSVC